VHRQKQLQGIIQDRLETVLAVKLSRGIIFGMHEEELEPRNLTGRHGPQDGILQGKKWDRVLYAERAAPKADWQIVAEVLRPP
jgi:hypothetical protein